MSVIRKWAAEHGVGMDAVQDLERRLGIGRVGIQPPHAGPAHIHQPGTEAHQQSLVRLEAARLGVRLFRNNSGALKDNAGRLVRFGLGNDSKQVNDVFKSPDLVGWRPRDITADMVGSRIAQVVLREMKPEDWTFSGDAHECAQLNFINLCVADGGDARFCTGEGTF